MAGMPLGFRVVVRCSGPLLVKQDFRLAWHCVDRGGAQCIPAAVSRSLVGGVMLTNLMMLQSTVHIASHNFVKCVLPTCFH